MWWILVRASLIALLALAYAQTTTTTDELGQTVIEVITTDVDGDFVTEIIQTVTSTTSTTAALSTVATTQGVQQGPVGVPQTTAATQSATVYTYTTTDAGGDTIAVVATFTPTTAVTVTPPETTTGTILDYSQWLSEFGSNTASTTSANAVASAAMPRWHIELSWLGATAGVMTGAFGGIWLILG